MRALILGVNGQDGSYLAELLLGYGYEVHGLYRRSSYGNLGRIEHLLGKIHLHQGDITDVNSVMRICKSVRPHEIYNEADQDHIGWSYACPEVSWEVTARAPATILEALRQYGDPDVKFFQPVSSTIFGDAAPLQSEHTPLNPLSPYSCAKAAVYHISRYYRQVHGMFVSTAILFNHDSPRRGSEYLLHQICRQVVSIKRGIKDCLELGDPDMSVDIGFAGDYVVAIHAIMQLEEPDDFVISSGIGYRIRELGEYALGRLGLPKHRWKVNTGLLRPGPQLCLIGDNTKLRSKVGFDPKVGAFGLIDLLLDKYSL